ncbi:MAG: hypothetical protein H0W09_00435, partial [Solirubrobacterales bacterium]|nr:hypothetical protein [Solirubrobacterales bacterium]
SPPTREVARARRPGWDTMGTTRRRGDSWVTQQEGSEFSQSTTSRRDHVFYMCAIHPDMQGRLNIAQPLR